MLELLAASNLAVCRQANNWIQAGHFPASDSQATAVLYSKHLQTKNSFNHLAACLNMLRTVLNMVGTLLCSKMKKDQKALPATWLEPGAGPCCLKPLHGLGSGPLVPLSDLSQAENSDATATCHLHTACLSYLQSFCLICVHVERYRH